MFGQKNREKATKARRRLFDALRKFPRINKKQPDSQNAEPQNSTTPPGSPILMTGLRVSVTVRFESEIDKNFHLTHDASLDFEVTGRVCNALLRRIDHCARELITRPDPRASEPLRHGEPRTKLARYHLIFRIDREGLPWKERHFTSFQELPLSLEEAHEVVLEADRIVALFFCCHDPGFEWILPSVANEGDPLQHKSSSPEVGTPQAMYCIPTYDDLPGYSIDLALRTQNKGNNRSWTVKVDSQQPSPLNLQLGENLMSQVTTILRQTVKGRENRFAEIHQHCDSLEGTSGCRHFEEAAFDLVAKIRNNLGPDYPHFSTRIQTFRQLLTGGNGDAFVQDLESQLQAARDLSDELINATDDLVLKVNELRSKDWKVHQPLTITMDSSVLSARKTMERMLQRVETSMTDVLRGHGTVAVLTAHKRGHLILETTVCRGNDTNFYDLKRFEPLHLQKRILQQRLCDRIQEDIGMVLKDTLSLHILDRKPKINIIAPADPAVEPLNDNAKLSQEQMASSSRRLLKKSPLFNLRRGSLEEAEAAKPDPQVNLAEDYGYMADMVSERSDSLDIPTPSLADTASINLQDGARTPQSTRAASQNFVSSGISIMNFDDFHHNATEAAQGHVDKVSTGTVIRHPPTMAKTATNLLESYWEPASSDSSGLDWSGSSVVRDLRVNPDIWKDGPGTNRASGSRDEAISNFVPEGSWLGNQFAMKQAATEKTMVQRTRTPLGAASGNLTPNEHKTTKNFDKDVNVGEKGPIDIAAKHVMVSKKGAYEGIEHAKFKSASTLAGSQTKSTKSQALILREVDSPLRFFPRKAATQLRPAHTLVHAQGIFHQRQLSFPAGGHLGLHGEWVIEMGLRNALVPPHLRRDRPDRRVQSWSGQSHGRGG